LANLYAPPLPPPDMITEAIILYVMLEKTEYFASRKGQIYMPQVVGAY